MDWMSLITAICLQVAPGAKISIEKCEDFYRGCVVDLASMPESKKKGLDEYKIASALFNVPKSRANLCK